jgi:hypothetical protein
MAVLEPMRLDPAAHFFCINLLHQQQIRKNAQPDRALCSGRSKIVVLIEGIGPMVFLCLS